MSTMRTLRGLQRTGLSSATRRALELPLLRLNAPNLLDRLHSRSLGDFVGIPAPPRPSPYFETASKRYLPDSPRLPRTLGSILSDAGWTPPSGLPQFHFDYLEWAERPEDVQRWQQYRSNRLEAWAPYVASTRAGFLLRSQGSLESNQVDLLRIHYGRIRSTIERGLGGNHLLRNLKALSELAYAFSRPDLAARHLGEYSKALTGQLDQYGGHEEGSPPYLALVLGDTSELLEWANKTSLKDLAPTDQLRANSAKMRSLLSFVLHRDNSLPRFHDSPEVTPDYLSWLNIETSLDPDGIAIRGPFARCQTSGLTLLTFVGNTPVSGHAHASFASVEMSDRQGVLLRNVGTSTYRACERRQFERSFRSHSAPQFESDPWEFFGRFRVGRVPSTEHSLVDQELSLSVQCRRTQARTRRTVRSPKPGLITIEDRVAGGRNTLRSRFYSAIEPVRSLDGVRLPGRLTIATSSTEHVEISTCMLASRMGEVEPGYCIEFKRTEGGSILLELAAPDIASPSS